MNNNKLEIEKFKNIKDFITDLQVQYLDKIANVILADQPYTRTQIRAKNRSHDQTDIRRKIAYIARIKYNIAGLIIADYLNVSAVQVSEYIHSAYNRASVDKNYSKVIVELLNKS